MRPVIFLDIDGVLATASSYKKAGATWDQDALLDPVLVDRFRKFVEFVDGGVVISSAWRDMFPLDFFQTRITDRVVGRTRADRTSSSIRNGQIMDYMEANGILREQVVILEDEHDMGPLRSRWVQTQFTGSHQGFTRKHLRKALQILGYKDADKISREIG